jgi:hypothetical protein
MNLDGYKEEEPMFLEYSDDVKQHTGSELESWCGGISLGYYAISSDYQEPSHEHNSPLGNRHRARGEVHARQVRDLDVSS